MCVLATPPITFSVFGFLLINSRAFLCNFFFFFHRPPSPPTHLTLTCWLVLFVVIANAHHRVCFAQHGGCCRCCSLLVGSATPLVRFLDLLLFANVLLLLCHGPPSDSLSPLSFSWVMARFCCWRAGLFFFRSSLVCSVARRSLLFISFAGRCTPLIERTSQTTKSPVWVCVCGCVCGECVFFLLLGKATFPKWKYIADDASGNAAAPIQTHPERRTSSRRW